jgi:nitronate monooxygenase
MWPDQRFLKLVGIDLPIIQAPMAGSNGTDMALAVSDAGGLGSLPCATLDVATLREALSNLNQATAKPININFFTHQLPDAEQAGDHAWLEKLAQYYDEMKLPLPKDLTDGMLKPFDEGHCEVLEALPPAVASFHFGLPPGDLVERLKSAGIIILSSATTPGEAQWLEHHGCDAVIAQGYEAGGHRGMFLHDDPTTQMGTMALVPQIVDAVKIPVIAAGGIGDGRGVAAAFALGASGVQVGTAYLFTREATISDVYRKALFAAKDGHSALTNVFSGRPARCLMNRAARELGPMSGQVATFPKGFNAFSALKAAGEAAGLRDFSAHYSGQSAPLGQATTAAQLTVDLAADGARRCRLMCAKESL